MKIRKPIFAFLILLILSTAMAAVIVVLNFAQSQEKANYRNELIAKNAVESLKILENDVNRVYDSTEQKTAAGVELTVSAMRKLPEEELSSGPRIFEDGAIVQIRNDEIIYPEDFPYTFDEMTADFLRSEPTVEFQRLTDPDSEDTVFSAVTARPITDDYWYIDWTSQEEYMETVQDSVAVFNIIKDLQQAFDGYIFLLNPKLSDQDIYYAPDEFEECSTVEELGLTWEMIEGKTPLLTIGNNSYSAHYTTVRIFGNSMIALILINSTDELMSIANNTLAVLLLICITVMAVVLWIYWIQTYVRDHEVTEIQKKDYHPGHVRRRTRSIGVVGVILIFIIAASMEALSSLSMESAKNNKVLNLMESRMVANTSMTSRYRADEESWIIYYAQKLSLLLKDYPDLDSRELLTEANDLIGSEYILLFDENGKEVQSSNSYIGLDLDEDLVSGGEDFGKLLQGARKVIHDPEPDLLDGETVQLIGTPIFTEDGGVSGAVIIAIDPEKSWQAAERKDYSSFLGIITPTGNSAYVVDKNTGKIIYSNEPDMEGENALEAGFYGPDAPETELDSFTIHNDQYLSNHYGAYQKDERYQYYFMTLADIFQNIAIPFGAGCAFGFLIIYWIVTSFMLRPYRADVYSETVRISNDGDPESLLDLYEKNEWLKLQKEDEETENLREIWRGLLPERKATAFIEIALALVLVIGAAMLLSGSSELTRSSIRFIMRGTWRRGLNLLSFAGIMILILSYMILIFCTRLMQNLINNILDRKAETVFRLVFSFIQWAALIALLFLAFDFLGFGTRTLLASVSVLSLAVTLGAKDLVADILAGIFIIFEDDFHVGDIIEVNGFSGIVQEIGVRSTKLIGIGDNIKIIGNESVKNVLNMSKMNSWYSLDLKIPADQPLREIEAMLELELPAIGESIPEIISGPYYKGVMAIGSVHTLYIIAECRQANYRRVQRELNHAVLMLFNDHGYKIC